MSYDIEIGTHEEPSLAQVTGWAAEKDLDVERAISGQSLDLAITDPARVRSPLVIEVGGPLAAETEDFSDQIAAACLAPRWMVTVHVSYSMPKEAITLARSLARELAERNAGAAFDPQRDGLIWPRGKQKRVAPRTEQKQTSVARVEWFMPAQAEHQAPEKLLELIARICPEVLPTRYGQFEPPPERFDPGRPDDFLEFLRGNDDGDVFWYARPPSFGGSFTAPRAAKYAKPDEDHLRIAHVRLNFDHSVLAEEPRWRETVIDLFAGAASAMGAFYGAIQIEPGWTVSRNNRLWITAENLRHSAEHIRRGMLWQGLPPVPVWVSWFGDPYRDLVAPYLSSPPNRARSDRPPSRLRRWIRARSQEREFQPDQDVREYRGGLVVRLGETGAPAAELPSLPLPGDLTYRERSPIRGADGSVSSNPAQPDDAAPVIPPLNGRQHGA